ncbi:dynein regulatory complex protein 1 isoform X1 [Maniola jurtina]|uniref:dynein regulatory complex protein 1 isoform X1 n=1 Tax=Maniola jurtina TaxID=191418 RepID=UPI001E687480|nr:dynein regulatory complex protein 1 isoform X1 [Maniola jurtina]
MAGKMGRYDDDEDDVLAPKEPQVTSHDPKERKAGRALRIKRRQEALKRAEQPTEEIFKEEEPGPIEQATTAAAEELQRLALDGAAKVTNVKVTTDEREVIRRALFSDKMQDSLQKLEIEAADAQTQYDAISANWDAMFEIKDPLDIDAAIKEQKRKCDDLLAQKDQLIDNLKSDLKKMDLAYYEDLDKQDKDIKELSDRIEKQITIMQRAYEKQLFLIEQAITIEREVLVDHNNKRWEALYKQRDKEEVAHLEYKFEQLEEHKLEVEAIMWDHHAKYREAKIELETLIQELQKELEKLKATCVINTEKIGYTYQVLKKREEENVFVRSQQKRKLNKMSDIANSLRSKIRKAAEDGALEELRADAEIGKLMQAMDELEKKGRHFSHVNNYKFSQVWRMSAARCGELVRSVRAAEVALHAHVLAEPPPLAPPPPPKSPLAKYEAEIPDPNSPQVNNVLTPANKVAEEAKENLVRHILQLVADNTGFLVEDRLLKLIEKYPLTSRNLCTLDSIFMALEIQAEEDIELLCEIFLNYAFCPICVGLEVASDVDGSALAVREMGHSVQDDGHHVSISVKALRGERSSTTRPHSSVHRSISASTTRSGHVAFKGGHELSPEDQLLMAEADEIIQKCGDPKVSLATADSTSEAASLAGRRGRGVTVSAQPTLVSTKKSNPFLCPLGHELEIESMQVLTALNEFMAVFVPPEKQKLCDILDRLKPPDFTTPSRKLTTQEIEQYWSQWKNLFPPEKDRFWNGLLTGLNSYLTILQERERIHSEVVQLRHRNAALRRLVRGALPELRAAAAAPRAARAPPAAFTASAPDNAPLPLTKLPPI